MQMIDIARFFIERAEQIMELVAAAHSRMIPRRIQWLPPILPIPRIGVFKNNWRKIVDLVTKIFNTLSAVADNDTKACPARPGEIGKQGRRVVADGIETHPELRFAGKYASLGDFGVRARDKGVPTNIVDLIVKAGTERVTT